MSDYKIPLTNVVFSAYSEHGYSSITVNYSITINDIEIPLPHDIIEKIMLAAGIGDVVWMVNWKKLNHNPYDDLIIIPRIRDFVSSCDKIFHTKDEAQTAVNRELHNRIDTLKKMIK